ncbi:hypothetical protein RvY_05517 [Ramazzottius varieornatus]|uniref:[Histone H3]-lysine(4) N-trimethyltransferase n=1 Tax=Ramazzottius varieornatus TaxID=947166 RepID=A0A1D1V556_RAMVA|nr:hypothetical protein RvY_05517 [Ramazzottius varieornatus]
MGDIVQMDVQAAMADASVTSSPSTSSVFSSSIEDVPVTDQTVEVSGAGGGKPLNKLKRTLPVNQRPVRNAKKRQRTFSSSVTPQTPTRKRGKGKSLPLLASFTRSESATSLANDEEELVNTSTVVLFRNTEENLQVQDICVSCGSIGVGEEGKLIGCAQCGQCYHPYCANVKLSSIILTKGWRCLDCTVCEGCGKPHDESRLILCDECDISFHIYCLEPPLDQVPQGTWKCKWCVTCVQCGSTSPGHGTSTWQNNYSTCTPCASLQQCPICSQAYAERDPIIQCLQCERWLHSACDSIMDEDDLESAVSAGYVCPFCRPENHPPLHLQHVWDDEDSAERYITDVLEVKPLVPHKYDGMLLSDQGIKHVKTLSLEHAKPRASNKNRKTSTRISESISLSADLSNDGSIPSSQELSNGLEDSSVDENKKKRTRKPQKFGVGGFLLRGPKPKAERDKEAMEITLQLDSSMESRPASGTLSPADSASVDTHLAGSTTIDSSKDASAKTKKKRSVNKKKVSVKESFPDYLQDAFFGRTLMEDGPSKDMEEASAAGRPSLSVNIDIPETPKVTATKSGGRPPVSSTESRPHESSSDEQRTLDHIKQSLTQSSLSATASSTASDLPMAVEDDDFPDFVDSDGGLDFLAGDLQDAGGVDELLAMLTAEQEDEVPAQEEEPAARPPRLSKEEGDPISDNFGSLWESIQGTDLPQMSCEDADNVLNDVFLNEEASVTMMRSGNFLGSEMSSQASTSSLQNHVQRPTNLPSAVNLPDHMALAPWDNSSMSIEDSGESAEQTAAAKNLKRHEEDEMLGEMATLSAVLYANVTQPDLKVNFPEWPERYKQIQKLWRKASTEDKKPYTAKARENAKLSKSVKAQKIKEEKEKTANAAAGLIDVRPAANFSPQHQVVSAQPPFGASPMNRFPSHDTTMEPYYSSSQPEEGFGFVNPPTPSSQPSTPGSAGHPQLQQFHSSSPAPTFSPPLDRPRSVLPVSHLSHEHPGIQSPHSAQQVQSPRTLYPPTSPFDPYANPPASVPASINRQKSELDEGEGYSQSAGISSPQRFGPPYPNPQSPQTGQFFPRQQLRDLLARQQGQRQRQAGPTGTWQYPPQNATNGNFPAPHQVEQHFAMRPAAAFPPQQQQQPSLEFRQPQPPQLRTMQQVPRSFPGKPGPTPRFAMTPRMPAQMMVPRQGPQPGMAQNFVDNSQHQNRFPMQAGPWQQQPQHTSSPTGTFVPIQQPFTSEAAGSQQTQVQPSFSEGQYNPTVQYRPPNPQGPPQSPAGVPRQMTWPQPGAVLAQGTPGAHPVFTPPIGRAPSSTPQPMPSNEFVQQSMAGPSSVSHHPPVSQAEVPSEAERQSRMKHKDWLLQYHHELNAEQAKLENDIAKVRKQKKSMSARQRQVKKNGGELSAEEAQELDRLAQQVTSIQKELERVRKANKEHNVLIQDWQNKTGFQLIPSPPTQSIPTGFPPVGALQTLATPPVQPQIRSPIGTFPASVSPSFLPNLLSPTREDQSSMHNFQEQLMLDQQRSLSPQGKLSQAGRFAVPQPAGPSFSSPTPHHPTGPPVVSLPSTSHTFSMDGRIQSLSNLSPTISSPSNPPVRSPRDLANALTRSATEPSLLSDDKSSGSSSGSQPGSAESMEKKNVLLKKLLEQGNTPVSAAAPATGVPGFPLTSAHGSQLERQRSTSNLLVKLEEEDDDNVSMSTLTPAQRQQLELIDKMPLEVQTEGSSSPATSSTMHLNSSFTAPSEASMDLESGKKKKKTTKKKKKTDENGQPESGSSENGPPAESVVAALVDRLRAIPYDMAEPQKRALPQKSVVVKSEIEPLAAVGPRQLEDLKKPQRRSLQGSFGAYEVSKQGPKSRFYVPVPTTDQDVQYVTDETSSFWIFQDCMKKNMPTLANNVDPVVKVERLDFRSPSSPALSFASTSSYGESLLLEPCYDHMYAWLDAVSSVDENFFCEMRVDDPVLPPQAVVFDTLQKPGTPASQKENFLEDEILEAKPEPVVVPHKPSKLLQDSDRVNVTLTITEEAARDLQGFMEKLANLLQVPVSDIIMTGCEPEPDSESEMAVVPSFISDEKPKFCCTCDLAMPSSAVIRKKLSDFSFAAPLDNGLPYDTEDGEPYVSFCGQQCLMQFALNSTNGSKASPPATVSVDHGINGSNGSVKGESRRERRESAHKRSSSVQNILRSIQPLLRKGKKTRHDLWSGDISQWKSISPVTERLTPEQILQQLDVGIRRLDGVGDFRACVLCNLIGDSLTSTGTGRLLNIDGDHWVHLNCALWSSDVYETINGHLFNVQKACEHGRETICVRCKKPGATLMCYKPPRIRCAQVFHFPCAKQQVASDCMFFKDKTLLCDGHKPKDHPEDELQNFTVQRRVCVNRDEFRLASKIALCPDGLHTFRVGTLIFHSIGQILVQHIHNFHHQNCVYPVGYSATRIFWSMRAFQRRCYYICSIHEVDGFPEFKIVVRESGFDNVVLSDVTTKGVWMKVLTAVLGLRTNAMIKVFPDFFTGDELFGLTEGNIARAIEMLPGMSEASLYRPKFEKEKAADLSPLAVPANGSGSAKTEPKLKLLPKRSEGRHAVVHRHTVAAVTTSLTTSSSGSQLSATFCDTNGLSYQNKVTHSKINQFRRMKLDWKRNVYLARSRIQGLGLFASRELDKSTMIVEYVGELIRNEVANNREKNYEKMNRDGIYMFRVDKDTVVDASRSGGSARFINHSCDPNCITEVVQTDKDNKKIVITSLRKILKGEELCYDYKFDFEDDLHKIPCNCGARNCRLWMN